MNTLANRGKGSMCSSCGFRRNTILLCPSPTSRLDCLLYLGPEKFPTRRHELLQKKPSKEISIDQAHLVVKDKQQDLTCPTVTELEVSNAFKRRALAFDLVGVCTYDVMAAYHADLLDHLHTLPPPGYSAVSVQQVLRADRADKPATFGPSIDSRLRSAFTFCLCPGTLPKHQQRLNH